jgi:hypothetical protein
MIDERRYSISQVSLFVRRRRLPQFDGEWSIDLDGYNHVDILSSAMMAFISIRAS